MGTDVARVGNANGKHRMMDGFGFAKGWRAVQSGFCIFAHDFGGCKARCTLALEVDGFVLFFGGSRYGWGILMTMLAWSQQRAVAPTWPRMILLCLLRAWP